ncbi:DUF1648 domain-containing protein [Glycomyces paridis]|uniref:DUF5808 domain-containing protein n=1 Tax=Glycomyces paridis TaxID=2126555 RepID=A0A4S8PJ47_9ACTN|nr:hypothetical protein [Glycomyces paridis]THV30697.1 hypothetical protein E9998_04740 [Glycomyces paridis]
MNLTALTLLLTTIAAVTAVWRALPALARPTLPFGTAVPADRADEPVVAEARRTYARRVLVLGVAAAVLAMPLALFMNAEAAVAAATVALIAADTGAYLLAGGAIRKAKRDGGWYSGTRQAVTADLSFRTDPVRVPWPRLVPAAAVLAATAVVGLDRAGSLPDTLPGLGGLDLAGGERVPTGFWTAANPALGQAAVLLVTALALAAIVRARPDLDAARPEATARRYREYLRSLANLGFAVAACVNLTLAGIALRLWELVPPSIPVTAAIVAPLLLAAAAAIRFELRVGAGGHRLPALPGEADEDTGMVQRDDDRHWHLGGFVYINPDDPAFLVHQRVGGSQWTVNLGSPAGRITGLILAAIILSALAITALEALGISGA